MLFETTYWANVHGSARASVCHRTIKSNTSNKSDIVKALKIALIEADSDESYVELISFQQIREKV